MPQLKIDIRHDALDCLSEAVQKTIGLYKNSLEFNADTIDEDRLLIAALEELWIMLEKKCDQKKYRYKTVYKITLTPVMGFALRVAFAGVLPQDYTTNLLHELCSEADKTFSIL